MKRREIVVDLFAGGGGASMGIEWATGRSPDICINHDEAAIRMHQANHPDSLHVLEDVRKANIAELVAGRPVGHLHASPDCRFFSRARGSKPIRIKGKETRSLMWVVTRWAEVCKPRLITVENVSEFLDAGPVLPQIRCIRCGWKGTEKTADIGSDSRLRCQNCKSVRLSETDEFVPDRDRKGLAFKQWVGRLRNLGYQVEWRILNAADYGAPTSRKRLFIVARNDGEFIYWPSPTHASRKEKAKHPDFRHLKPHRAAAECIDWSIHCPSIFERKRPLVEKTLTRIAHGIKRFVLDSSEPFVVPLTHSGSRNCPSLLDGFPTITGAKRGEFALCSPIVAKYHSAKSANDSRCNDVRESLRTLDTQPRYALVAAFIAKHFGGQVGTTIENPLPTTTSRGTQNQVVAASLIQAGYGERPGQSPRCLDTESPLGTVVAGGSKHALVYAFLSKYFGTAIGQQLDAPIGTLTSKARYGLVTVAIGDQQFAIVDIGMRMLTARELAKCQGFPEDYELTGTKTEQIAKIGNSVPPHVIDALVSANLGERPGIVRRETHRKQMA